MEFVQDATLLILGVVVGAIVSHFLTKRQEAEKWNRERSAKRQDEKRAALEKALEWISPMTNAVQKAPLIASGACYGHLSREELQKQWPRLLTQLTKLDLPAHHIALLPDDVYPRGHRIHATLETLRDQADTAASHIAAFGPPAPEQMWNRCMDLSEELNRQLRELHDLLEREYKSTFD